MMMKSSLFESHKSYLYGNNLKNSKIALLRYIIFIQNTPILYHKLPKSPLFLQAPVTYVMSLFQKLFVYGLYQLQNIAFICSVYQTIVLAFQRYFAISNPIEYYMDNNIAAVGKYE